MVHGFKLVGDVLVLDIEALLMYEPLAKLYKADPDKSYIEQLFKYAFFIGDKSGVCKQSGFTEKEAHEWAVRNARLRNDYKPDTLVKNAIKCIEDELNVIPVEELMDVSIRGLTLTSRAVKRSSDYLQKYLEVKNFDDDTLEAVETKIIDLLNKTKDLPDRIKNFMKLRQEWDKIQKGVTIVRGGNEYKSSLDGLDEIDTVDDNEVEHLT